MQMQQQVRIPGLDPLCHVRWVYNAHSNFVSFFSPVQMQMNQMRQNQMRGGAAARGGRAFPGGSSPTGMSPGSESRKRSLPGGGGGTPNKQGRPGKLSTVVIVRPFYDGIRFELLSRVFFSHGKTNSFFPRDRRFRGCGCEHQRGRP